MTTIERLQKAANEISAAIIDIGKKDEKESENLQDLWQDLLNTIAALKKSKQI